MSDAARADLFRLINGFQVSQAIFAAAALGLANLMRDGARTSDELAAATGTVPGALYRLMRTLAAVGVFRESDEGTFALTERGEYLRDDIAGTHAPMARLFGRPHYWQAWSGLLHSTRTGQTGFDHVLGCGVWEYRRRHPEETGIFDRAMAAGTERYGETLLEAFDFSRFAHLVDVGGGDGMLLAKILGVHPHMRGTLFDQPHVIAGVVPPPALADRCALQAGDFFATVPEGADCYLLKWILHDWDDAASVAILRTVRRAMKPASKLLVVEHVVGPPNTAPEGKLLDLMMLVITGGRERTRDEFSALFASAGFRLTETVQTSTLLSVLVCAPE